MTSRSCCASKEGLQHDDLRVLATLFGKNAKPGADVDLGDVREAAAAARGDLRAPHRRVHRAARLPQQAAGWIGLVRGVSSLGGFFLAMGLIFFADTAYAVLDDRSSREAA